MLGEIGNNVNDIFSFCPLCRVFPHFVMLIKIGSNYSLPYILGTDMVIKTTPEITGRTISLNINQRISHNLSSIIFSVVCYN